MGCASPPESSRTPGWLGRQPDNSLSGGDGGWRQESSGRQQNKPIILWLWMIEGSYTTLATLQSYRSSDNIQLKFMSQFFTLKSRIPIISLLLFYWQFSWSLLFLELSFSQLLTWRLKPDQVSLKPQHVFFRAFQ